MNVDEVVFAEGESFKRIKLMLMKTSSRCLRNSGMNVANRGSQMPRKRIRLSTNDALSKVTSSNVFSEVRGKNGVSGCDCSGKSQHYAS